MSSKKVAKLKAKNAALKEKLKCSKLVSDFWFNYANNMRADRDALKAELERYKKNAKWEPT